MLSNVFDRDKWLDMESYAIPVSERQAIADGCHEDTLGWWNTWPQNIDHNMAHMDGTNGFISSEYGLASGPVIVCGAGPSLSRNIDYVRHIHDNFGVEVIACDRALRTLKEGGIRPSLTVAADASKRVVEFFDGCTDEQDVVALCLVTDPEVAKSLKCPIYWYGLLNPFSGFWNLMRKKFGNEMACVRSGVVVGFNAVDIALWMGYSPIYTIGMELSFKDREEADEYLKISPGKELGICPDSGRYWIEDFALAAKSFSTFPYFHSDIGFVDLSDGVLPYYGWIKGEPYIGEKKEAVLCP